MVPIIIVVLVVITIIIIITIHVIVVVGVVVALHARGFRALEARELHEPIIVSAAIVQPCCLIRPCKPSIVSVVAFIAALFLATPSHLHGKF